jgi:hypothetical protein
LSDTFSSRYALSPIIFVPHANCPRYTLSITLCIYEPKNFLPCRIKKIPDLLPGHLFSIYEYIVDHLSCFFYFTFGLKRIFNTINHKFTVKTFDSNVTTVFKSAWLYFWAAESAGDYFRFEGFFQGAKIFWPIIGPGFSEGQFRSKKNRGPLEEIIKNGRLSVLSASLGIF